MPLPLTTQGKKIDYFEKGFTSKGKHYRRYFLIIKKADGEELGFQTLNHDLARTIMPIKNGTEINVSGMLVCKYFISPTKEKYLYTKLELLDIFKSSTERINYLKKQ